MKKLLGLLAVAPMALTACTVEIKEDATPPTTIKFDLLGGIQENNLELNPDLVTVQDYMDAQVSDLEYTTHGNMVLTLDRDHATVDQDLTCADTEYQRTEWQLQVDGVEATEAFDTLVVEEGKEYSFMNISECKTTVVYDLEDVKINEPLDVFYLQTNGSSSIGVINGEGNLSVANLADVNGNALFTYEWDILGGNVMPRNSNDLHNFNDESSLLFNSWSYWNGYKGYIVFENLFMDENNLLSVTSAYRSGNPVA